MKLTKPGLVLQGYFRSERFAGATSRAAAPQAPRPKVLPAQMRAVVGQPKVAPRSSLPRPDMLPGMRPATRPDMLPGMRPATVGQLRPRAQVQPSSAVSATPIPPEQLRVIGQGQPIEPAIRKTMERYFQADFSKVRIFQGATAQAMGALAFTVGDAIHFAPGLYDPSTRDGVTLLGHELAHVVQQRNGRVVNPYGTGVAIVQDPALEAEADWMGQQVAEEMWLGPRVGPRMGQATTIHRELRAETTAGTARRAIIRLLPDTAQRMEDKDARAAGKVPKLEIWLKKEEDDEKQEEDLQGLKGDSYFNVEKLDRQSDEWKHLVAFISGTYKFEYVAMPAEPARIYAVYRTKGIGPALGTAFNELWKRGPRAGGPAMELRITKIKRIKNPLLSSQYKLKRQNIEKELKQSSNFPDNESASESYSCLKNLQKIHEIDTRIGECLLFHGTSKSTMRLIAKGGFQRRFAENKMFFGYGALGRGGYFSDEFSKVACYTNCHVCGEYLCECKKKHSDEPIDRVIMISKVVLGWVDVRVKEPFGELPREEEPQEGYHSKYGDRSSFDSNEFLIGQDAQALPLYFVYYTQHRVDSTTLPRENSNHPYKEPAEIK
jgi:hypothetical protein